MAVRRLTLANVQLAGRSWEEVAPELQRFLEALNDMHDDEVASPTTLAIEATEGEVSPENKPHIHSPGEIVGIIEEVLVRLPPRQHVHAASDIVGIIEEVLVRLSRPHDHYPPDPADAQTILAGRVFGG